MTDPRTHLDALKATFAELTEREGDEAAADQAFELLGETLRWCLQQDGSIWHTQSGTAGYLVTLSGMVKDEEADQTLTALAVEPIPQDTRQAISDQRAQAELRMRWSPV